MRSTAILKMRPAQAMFMRSTQIRAFRPTQFLGLHTSRQLRAVPKEEHSAHTISQRLRTLKKMPVELVPLAVVLGVAIVAAVYSLINKLYSDKTLRLTRTGFAKKEGH